MSIFSTFANSELRKRVLMGLFLILAIGVPIISGGTPFVTLLFVLCMLATVEYVQIAQKPRLSAMILIVLVFVSVYCLRIESDGLQKIVVLSLAIAFFDTFAYFIGKYFGKHKLAPQISPGKTIEGFLGGIIVAVVLLAPLYYIFDCKIPFFFYIALLITLSSLSQMGDLLESAFKRKHGVKDSGNIIPGHGGILDRFDGYILTAPFFVCLDIVLRVFNVQIF